MGRGEKSLRAPVDALNDVWSAYGCTVINGTHSSRMPDRRRWTHRSTIVNFLCCVLLLSLELVQAREADVRSRFLYADDPRATIILEYQLHNAPTKDYAAEELIGVEYDEERHIRPYFLNPENGRRVVQYYSPWCGHCQSFKAKYIALAKEINHRLPYDDSEINFHAVSCSVYHWVCMQNNVKGFPTFVLFHADSAEPHWLKEEEMTVERIAETFGVQLQAPPEMGNGLDSNREGIDEIAPIDILGASVNGLARTRETLYKDAALSFVHALKTGIFLHEDGGETRDSLNSVQREVFSDWIDLLSWSLPPSWILHTLINEIRNNIDYVMDSEENLMLTVSKHEALVLGGNMKWSTQCSEHAGYSCGLWGLLHIISMGVIERHRAVLGARDQVSTQFVARTTRNYIEHFFDCKQCKEYFLSMYDTCGFNHCRRFKQSQKVPSKESWSEFSLWLWEVHNDVNIKLANSVSVAKVASKGEDSGDRRNRNADVFSWPSQGECPACRGITGKWDKDAVLSHLKQAYWPGGVQNFRYVVLKKKDKKRENERSRFILDKFVYVLLAGIIFMWCTRKRNVASSGRHKKTDHDYL